MVPAVVQSLATLQRGVDAEVVSVEGGGAIAVRLLEMGFVPGSHVSVVKAAPFGDPLEFCLRGYHVSLRKAEAARVKVTGVKVASP
ncbi:MAG: ferrous iron transport protein A [Nannocystaceae bacterium]|nr:ferrous iron transport protein A [Nannocystaceae bacterium]